METSVLEFCDVCQKINKWISPKEWCKHPYSEQVCNFFLIIHENSRPQISSHAKQRSSSKQALKTEGNDLSIGGLLLRHPLETTTRKTPEEAKT